MKKAYMQPAIEAVQIRLKNSVLETIPVHQGSFYTGSGLGKETNLDFDDEADDIYPSMDRKSLWDD
jgi:hypothetical protein